MTRTTDGQLRRATPPGPRLPWPVQTMILTWWRRRWTQRLRAKYGDVITVKIYPWRTVVLLANPDHIAALITAPPSRFHVGEGNRVFVPVMGEHSLLTSDGKEHRRQRRLLTPLFAKAAVRGYQETVRETTEREVEKWPTARSFRSLDRMRALTMDIMTQVIFGITDSARLNQMRALLDRLPYFDVAVLIGLASSTMRRYGRWRRAADLLSRIDTLIYQIITEREAAPDLDQRTDVLSRLVNTKDDADPLSPVEIRDQLITLMIAGSESTATGLAWALHELARNPVVAREATRAALTDDTAYLEALFKESLRHRPVIFEMTWTLTEDMELNGFLLPKGATLMPLIGIVHTDSANYPAPEKFSPERFLDNDVPPRVWIPFGGGVRRCIGAHMATVEATEILRVVLSRRAITTDRPRPEPAICKTVTIVPASGHESSRRRWHPIDLVTARTD